jgi:hypothetical protein
MKYELNLFLSNEFPLDKRVRESSATSNAEDF